MSNVTTDRAILSPVDRRLRSADKQSLHAEQRLCPGFLALAFINTVLLLLLRGRPTSFTPYGSLFPLASSLGFAHKFTRPVCCV